MTSTNWFDVSKEIREETELDYIANPSHFETDEDCERYAHESADGSQYVIYVQHVWDLWASSSQVRSVEDEVSEFQSQKAPGVTDVMTTCVYMASYSQVMNVLRTRSATHGFAPRQSDLQVATKR